MKKASDYIKDSSKEYSIYVCESRSIPKITDGLKAGQRKALWLMRNKEDKIKTVSLAGLMISKNIYDHGDAAAADSISRLAAPYINNVTFLEGVGTFGTRVAPIEGIGAPRYTYVKKNKATEEIMLADLDIVPLVENYDGSTQEPSHFLPLIPTVLLNGISGIAVGWSTEILPRDIKDIINGCIDIIDGKKINKLMPYYQNYDVEVKETEDEKWEISGKLTIVDSSTIRITELPPELSLIKFKERLNTMEDEKKISTYTDKTTKTIDIVVKFSRGTIKDWSYEKAMDFFKLRQKKTERIVVVDWNGSSIKQYNSAEDVLSSFVDWRLKWYINRFENKLEKDEYELGYWKGIKMCFDDKLPARLNKIKNRNDLNIDIDKVTKLLKLDDNRIERIVNLPAYRWTIEAYDNVLKKITELEENIRTYNEYLSDESKRKALYRKELVALSKMKF